MFDPSLPPESVPTLDVDPFAPDALREPYTLYRELRELAPVVYVPKYQIFAAARHAEIRAVLNDWQTFVSSAGVGLANIKTSEAFRPPSLVLEADPPAHAGPHALLARVLSAVVVQRLRGTFRAEAEELVNALLERGTIDGVRDLARAYPLKVFPDAVGLTREGRENLLAYADMVFNATGPRNDLFVRAARNAEPLTR